MTEQTVLLRTEIIALSQLLKWIGEAMTGGEAKQMIQQGQVKVNGEVCLQRGKKLRKGDRVDVGENNYLIDYAVG